MADKYIALNGFKFGLDGRREALTSLPGTLSTLKNAHINAGGEIEQRLTFAKDANLFPTNCFGLQDTDTGLMTFGSDSGPNAALPTGVVYQQLHYPLPFVLPPENQPTLSAVVYSCNFQGKAFVIASWIAAGLGTDLGTFLYYNGNAVPASFNGRMITGGVTNLATALATQINGNINGYSATPNVTVAPDGTLTVKVGSVTIISPPSVHFTPVPSESSTNGILAAKLVDQNGVGVAATAAAVAFTLNVGTTGNVTLTGPANSADILHTMQISGGAVPFNASLAQTAADIAAAVNLFSSATGYYARSSGATVTVYAPTAFGNFGGFASNFLHVVTTGDITTVGATAANFFILTTSPDPIKNIIGASPSDQVVTSTVTATAATSGALMPGAVMFKWEECNPDGSTPVTTKSPIVATPDQNNGPTCVFTLTASLAFFGGSGRWLPGTYSRVGYFKVTATDPGGSFGSPASKTCLVTLGFTVPPSF